MGKRLAWDLQIRQWSPVVMPARFQRAEAGELPTTAR
jgi:hypothetical protein